MPRRPKKLNAKSRRQVGFLLSKSSPLTSTQKNKLKRELKSGKVKIKKK